MSENNLEGILSRHGLHKKDLQKECSREVVVRFAIEAHVDSKTLGQFLNYEEEWLEAIEREYENEGKRREVLLDVLGGQSRPSYLLLANTMCRKQRPDLVELLCNVLVQSTSKSESDGGGELQDSQVNQLCVRGINVDSEVNVLKKQFDSLRERILSRLTISVTALLDAFSSLPVSTKNEFDSSVGDILRNLDVEEGNHNVASYMCYLKPIMTFLNYGLIRHLITKFGDAELQQDMKLYIDAVGVFIKDTTIEMVMDCYSPDEVESHINYTKVMITFNRNPKTYSLERLSNFRAKFCKKTQQSEHIFGLIALKVGSSFCATWLIPTVITTKLMEATLNQLDQTFYQEEDVALVSLEGQDSNKLLYISAASGEVSIENAERTIASLTDTLKSESLLTSSDQLIPLNLLQQLSVLLEALASLMPTVSQLESSKSTESQSVLKHCRNIFDMSCICELQIRIISGFSSISDRISQQYWYSKVLQSSYVCFRYLKLMKLIKVDSGYFYGLLSCTLECLRNLQQKKILSQMLLMLLRITYACLSGIPMETLAVSDVFFTVVHYFHHIDQDVQVAAMNAGQFLIPYIKSSLTRRSFILNDDNIKTLLHSFGKSMPVSSSLKLLHSFSLLQENCVTFVKKSIPLLSTSIMLLSPRVIEKELAFQLLWNMFHVHSGDQVKSTDSSGDSEVSVPAEYAVEDVLSELNIKLKRVLDDDLPSVQEWYTDLESLLKYLKRALSTCQQCEIQKLSTLMVQCVNKITRTLSEQTSSELLKRLCSFVFAVYDFWKELDNVPDTVGGTVNMSFPLELKECVENIMKYLQSSCAIRASTFEDLERAHISLLKAINVAADHFSFDTSVICQVVQDCAGLFASSFSSDIRTVSLSIIHKLDSSSGMFNLCLSAMTDIDIEAILFHLQKQSLLPASELLCVLDLASQYGKVSKCHEAIEILSTIEVEEQRIKAAVNTLHSAAQGIHLETTLSITELLLQLPEFLGRFKTSITQIDTISHARLSFPLLKEILNELDKIVCRLETSSPQSVVCELNNILLDAVNELLPAIVETSETQYQRWGNFIVFSCWRLIKEIRKRDVVMHKRQGQSVIGTLLQAISNCTTRDNHEEISLRTVDLCLGMLQDFLFDNICDQLGIEEYSGIKTVLLDIRAIRELPAFRFELQVILSFLYMEESSLKQELILDQTLVTNQLIPKLSSLMDATELKMLLNKLKALSNIAENRQLFRNSRMLLCLGTLMEHFTNNSVVEASIAELIHVVLSDAPDTESDVAEEGEKVNAIAMFEEFMTYSYDDKQKCVVCPLVSTEEILQATCYMYSEKKTASEFVMLHAECMRGLMVFAKDMFQLILTQPDQVVNIKMMMTAVEHLKKLCIAYEQDISAADLKDCEHQVIYLSRKYFPEMFCVSFKALEDVYSTFTSDVDRTVYITLLVEYLRYLHFVVEQWSRMNGMQEILVECGAFFLLLNELHTASTTPVLDENLLYSTLTTLYNVALKSECALHFRIVITLQLLKQFMSSRSASLRLIAKFSYSCFHRILSRSEMKQLKLDRFEVDMLARCLNGVDKFFGGYDHLLLTVSKLTSFPNLWRLFAEGGFVQILISLALTKSGCTQVYAVKALLNMIPEAVIDESHNETVTKSACVKPLTNQATVIVTSSLKLMEFVKSYPSTVTGVCSDLLQGIKLLTQPLDNPDTSSIAVLNRIERYPDCWRFCNVYLSKVKDACDANRRKVMFYKAKSMSQDYNRELPEMIEKSQTLPGFEYKSVMRTFCRKRILEVIQILTKFVNTCKEVKPSDLNSSNSMTESDKYDDAVVMLDKALLDYLVFSTAEVQTCLLCHVVTRKLTHSHYIPKAIIQEFVKAMGLDPGDSIYIFAPTGHPSDWYYKSASKLTFSMLCKSCDGKLLSKDESHFKKYVFDHVYSKGNPESAKSLHTIPYGQYLLRFTAGLFFRNIAPLYSQVCAEIGTFKDLHHLMQLCRSIVLEQSAVASSDVRKFFLLALPSSMPDSIAIPGWDNFVATSLSPYLAYELLRPGKPIIPKKLLCCMVKIGVLFFVTSFDHDLELQLLTLASQSLIQSDSSNAALLYIPKDEMRSTCIPEKLWWSLTGWAKKEINTSLSTGLSTIPQRVKRNIPTHLGEMGKVTLTSTQSILQAVDSYEQHGTKCPTIVANMLPPGFSVNFNEYNTLPEKVIDLPVCHSILLHQPFQTSNRTEGFAILCKLNTSKTNTERKKDHPAYSWSAAPYILMYFHQSGVDHNTVIKVGFYVDEVNYSVEGALPGCPPKMTESPHLREIITQIPRVVHSMLRSKGFLNMKSLLYWHEALKNVNDAQIRIPCALDTRCWGKNCNYCDMRCDSCLRPCLHRYEVKSIVNFNTVQSCSKECSNILFGHEKCRLKRIVDDSEMFVSLGHTELYRGEFSLDSRFSGLSYKIFFSICQRRGQSRDSLPPSTKYVKFWQRSLEKPYCVEYLIDDQFNALEMIHFQESKSAFSPGEEIEMMHQFHDMLVKLGIPYQIMQMEMSTLRSQQ